MTRFCIYCGRSGSRENPIVEGVCLECRIKRRELYVLKNRDIRVDMCKICGSVKIGYKWFSTNSLEEAIDVVVREVISKSLKPLHGVSNLHISGYRLLSSVSWRIFVEITVNGVYGGVEFSVKDRVTVFFSPVKCPRCIMYDSRDFEAVLQIRGYQLSRVEKVVEQEFRRDCRLLRDFIEAIKQSNGVDIFFYSKGAARKLARRLQHRLGGVIYEAFEETGVRSGKQHTRLYIVLKPSR